MSTSEILCGGLDGSDPLTMLASMGLFGIADRAGFARRLSWRWVGGWRPVLESNATSGDIVDAVVEALVGRETAAARAALEADHVKLVRTQDLVQAAEARFRAAGGPEEVREARAEIAALKARAVELKKDIRARNTLLDMSVAEAVGQRHPVTIDALHLDDAATNGLSRSRLVELASAELPAPYLCGLACDTNLPAKKKVVVGRTHLSFSNGGSGKMLLKDFAALAGRVTADRVDDAVFGNGMVLDDITGLGWDPASQRSYALRFDNPENEVRCQVVHHALAFFGLACFPVLPLSNDRATVGVYRVPVHAATQIEDAEGDDDNEPTGAGVATQTHGTSEYLCWPIWECPLSFDEVRALLARQELAQPHPAADACQTIGIVSIMRSRRFTLNKRSYFAPAKPVFDRGRQHLERWNAHRGCVASICLLPAPSLPHARRGLDGAQCVHGGRATRASPN